MRTWLIAAAVDLLAAARFASLIGYTGPAREAPSNTATGGPPPATEIRCYSGNRVSDGHTTPIALRRTVDAKAGTIYVEEALPGAAKRYRWVHAAGLPEHVMKLDPTERTTAGTLDLAGTPWRWSEWKTTIVSYNRYQLRSHTTASSAGLVTTGAHYRDDEVSGKFVEKLEAMNCTSFEPLRDGFQIL